MTWAKELRVIRSPRGIVTARCGGAIAIAVMPPDKYREVQDDTKAFEVEMDKLEIRVLAELRRVYEERK